MTLLKKVVIIGGMLVEQEHAGPGGFGRRDNLVNGPATIVRPVRMDMQVRAKLPKRTGPGYCLPFVAKGQHGPMNRLKSLEFKSGERLGADLGGTPNRSQKGRREPMKRNFWHRYLPPIS